ncbi:hypothetical protein PCC6912_47510 [Chlorogloeopsis fritschii PCC 6912]|uniref:Uncharacterized protein n=1 Tax=Chlorogloeopsis fritschii PCC 6912 TaxID=211165 RepID=A0A3S0ZG06_CHLFR|nr:hypothetical protein PCC6912_47510 [Chlorogloeopsis fritschii PCC 6912]
MRLHNSKKREYKGDRGSGIRDREEDTGTGGYGDTENHASLAEIIVLLSVLRLPPNWVQDSYQNSLEA